MKKENREVTNIFAVLGAALLCAVLFSIVFIFYYGPSGRYVAAHTLLDPSVIDQMNYQGPHTKSQNGHFVFDRIEFSYLDQQSRKRVQETVSLEAYLQLYDLLAADISLTEVPNAVETLFDKSNPLALTTWMRTREGGSSSNQVFQVVQFIEEDYYRVQLRTSRDLPSWAYFYHPQVLGEARQLFNPAARL